MSAAPSVVNQRRLEPVTSLNVPQIAHAGLPGHCAPDAVAHASEVERLGLNQGGYRGECIDIEGILDRCAAAAMANAWNRQAIPPAELHRPAFHRPSRNPGAPRVYISAGIHGDEPAGPVAALGLLEASELLPDADLWLIPCLNPEGIRRNCRTHPSGIDLNRDYRHLRSPETAGHVEWLQSVPRFDLTLLLHEDWESHGFYAYELNGANQPSLARHIVGAVRRVCPVDESLMIDGRTVSEPGIIRPDFDPETRPDWPEALWLGVHKSPLGYTLEAPSDWPLQVRALALVTAVHEAIRQLPR